MKKVFGLITALIVLGFTQNCLAEPQAPTLIIRSIKVEIVPIFDKPQSSSFYQTVNDIKASTEESVVRRELFFTEGDVYDQFLVDESERALRALPFLRKIRITSIQDGEFMDMVVSAQDTWTLFPEFGFSSGGGSDKTSVGVSEANFLGWGKRAEFFYADDEGRETYRGLYQDIRLLGSDKTLTASGLVREDGEAFSVFFGRPFRGLVEPTAWSTGTDYSDLVKRLFKNGDERFIFREENVGFGARYIISVGEPETTRYRYTLGYQYTDNDFTAANDRDFRDADVDPTVVSRDPELLPEDRRYSGPLFSVQRIHPDFISENYIDRFERIEDFNLGNQLSLVFFLAPKITESTRDTFIFSMTDSQGHKFKNGSFIKGEIGAATKIDHNGLSNSIIRTEGRYFYKINSSHFKDVYVGQHTLAVNFTLEYADDLEKDKELLLGAENGLRGYKDRTFTGDKRFLINFEDRIHLASDVLQLFNIGGVGFIDIGGSTDESLGNLFENDIYGNFGVGLRIGLPRSSGGTVVRLDVAFPFRDGPDDSEVMDPRIYITTGQLFSSRLRSERFGPERANLALGEAR